MFKVDWCEGNSFMFYKICFIDIWLGGEVCLPSTSESGCKDSDRNLDSRQTMCVPKSEKFLISVQFY